MERVCKFLKDAGTYYLATVEGDQPRVRPFGTAHIFEGRLYIQTGKIKPVSRQLLANSQGGNLRLPQRHMAACCRRAGGG